MRILLAEDDGVLADALTRTLRESGYSVDWLDSGRAADNALSTQIYDLVILDLGLPAMDGFEVLSRLRGRRERVPVLVLTARDGLDDRVRGLDLGADDYLTKPFDVAELEARVRAVVRRAQGAAGALVHVGALVLDMAGRRVMLAGQALELSAREYSVLEILLLRAGRVVSKDQLMHGLFQLDQDVGVNAIEVYMHRIRKKLADAPVNIRTVRGLGYLLEVGANG
jgi:two-component system OmpR family response regulator